MKKCGIPENNSVFVKGEWKTEDPYYQAIALLNEKVAALEAEIESGSGVASRLTKLETLFGVGAIWITISNDDPGAIFGGTWEKLEDRFLLCSGTNAAGATGGSSLQQIQIGLENLPAHTHHENEAVMVENDNFGNLAFPTSGQKMTTIGYVDAQYGGDPSTYFELGNTSTQNDATGTAVSPQFVPDPIDVQIIPDYVSVNVWKRIS